MSLRSINYENSTFISKGINYILGQNSDYDVRKIKGKPEYVVFFADEEVGHLDAWGKKTLATSWGPETEKGYVKSPEAAIKWVIDLHKKRLGKFLPEPQLMTM